MKSVSLVVLLALAGPVRAVDTPTVVQPTGEERMVSARDAIGRKGWSRAQFELLAVLRDNPRNADAHNMLAYSYRKQDKPDLPKAFEHYKIALQLNPSHRGAHEYIGEAYLADRQPALAEHHLAELEKICGNHQCEEYLDLAQAIAAYRKSKP